jgi:hypothetical protein
MTALYLLSLPLAVLLFALVCHVRRPHGARRCAATRKRLARDRAKRLGLERRA